MVCGACATRVPTVAKRVDGVGDVVVSHAHGRRSSLTIQQRPTQPPSRRSSHTWPASHRRSRRGVPPARHRAHRLLRSTRRWTCGISLRPRSHVRHDDAHECGGVAAATPALVVGHLLGRVGCFLVGDDYGRPTSLSWGVAFPQGLPPTAVPVRPTQLYEVSCVPRTPSVASHRVAAR